MRYDFDRVIDRRNSDSIKWLAYDEDVLPMWVADMDFVSPEPVLRALHDRIDHGIFGYPAGAGLQTKFGRSLVETVIDRLYKNYHWVVQPEELVFLPGVVSAFNLACHTVAIPGGEVIVQTPVYHPFLSAPHNAGMKRVNAQLLLNSDRTYTIDYDAFEAAINPQTRLFILCNPHNPVGRVFLREELQHMAEICLRNNVIICSDEIHCELVYPGHAHIPIATLGAEISRRTITLMAPSKTFNLAGLQCSFAIIQDPELRKRFTHSHKGLLGWVNLMGMTAALAAYRDGTDWLEQLLVYLEGNRNLLYQYFSESLPGIHMSPCEGTYLAWLDCRKIIHEKPYDFFLREARVALSDGEAFGPGGEGFVRLNFGCPRSTLKEALQRFNIAVERLKVSI